MKKHILVLFHIEKRGFSLFSVFKHGGV